MILDIVKSFLEIVDLSFKIKDKIIKPIDKEAVSFVLLQISNLLASVADDLEQNIYPHAKCGTMWSYMTSFQKKLEGKIDPDDVNYLSSLIKDCYQVERLLGELQRLDSINKESNLNKLREASGNFKAASELIKI